MKRSDIALLDAKWQLAKNAQITAADIPYLIKMIDTLFLLLLRLYKEKEDSHDTDGTSATRQ